jgi:hypothetical protein
VGASGKKLQGQGAPHKNKSPMPTPALGWEATPHPLRVINGQRYAPLAGRTRRPFVVTSHLKSGSVFAVRTDASQERFALTEARLLAVDAEGAGLRYRFIAFTPGRRYRTFAFLAELVDGQALLRLPDWHPARPVRYPAALLPDGGDQSGQWMRCSADLGQPQGAQLNIADLEPCPDPGPQVCHRPQTTAPPPAPTDRRPRLGRGCGDIVVELVDGRAPRETAAVVELFLPVPVMLGAGSRAYLAAPEATAITGYLEVRSSARSPNGTRVCCGAREQPAGCPIAIDNVRVQGRWRWRWWPRELESPVEAARIADYHYDPVEHCDDDIWRRRSVAPLTVAVHA